MYPDIASSELKKAAEEATKDLKTEQAKELSLACYRFPEQKRWGRRPSSESRENNRLMVLHKTDGKIEHLKFEEILTFFSKDDLFVFNNTKTFPALYKVLKYKREDSIKDGGFTIILTRELNKEDGLWDALVGEGYNVEVEDVFYFGAIDELRAEVVNKTTSKSCTIQFRYGGTQEAFRETLFSLGKFYIPDKIKALSPNKNFEGVNNSRIATEIGAVSPAAAGLHFSDRIFNQMQLNEIKHTELTVHIGLGHFRTPDSDRDHLSWSYFKQTQCWQWMNAEHLIISDESANKINKAKNARKKVVSVGVSVLRGLESNISPLTHLIKPNDKMPDKYKMTDKFIRYPYTFSIPDALVTNFHMPCTPSLICAAAFAGLDNLKRAYEEAIRENYRFGPYGDAMLIL